MTQSLLHQKLKLFLPVAILAICFNLSASLHAEESKKAVAVLTAMSDSSVAGTFHFELTDAGIKITGTVTGLTPGKHGFHVHQYGDLTKADGTSAGGHFNPHGSEHAGPHADHRHVGDLGNIVADESGTAVVSIVDTQLTFSGDNSIIGRSVVVHAGEDDLSSQPSGAAGARVAVGVVGIAAP
jgi:Cu-Zn family superoxide dismutase